MPGDFEKAMRHFASFVPDKSPESMLSQAFSTPALGYTREWQQEVQHLGQLWLSHFEALREYGMLLAQCTQCAAERLQEKLTTLTEAGKVPDTLRGFYDLWVDAGEETYAELANGPDYGKAQARLTNSLMAVKRQEQKMVDEVLSALNMPPRRELDTSHRRTHQLQREVWRLQEAFEDAGIQALRDEVAALRRELEGLREVAKAEQSPKPNSAAKSPRTPSRKAGA
jgi:class III poly(R)-hydroxyalkanoic acid synthase PhaE subunit